MPGKLPAFMFYPADWLQDTRPLSLEAKGAWADILCALWRSETRGEMTLTLTGWARIISATEVEANSVVAELARLRICEIVTKANGDITLRSRRQVREESDRENNRKRQARFRSTHKDNEKVTFPSSVAVTVAVTDTTLKPPLPPKGEVEIPEDLKANEPEIREWLAHKRELGKGYKPTGLKMLWKRLRDIPESQRKVAIEQSIAANYAGIFPPKGDQNAAVKGAAPQPGKYSAL